MAETTHSTAPQASHNSDAQSKQRKKWWLWLVILVVVAAAGTSLVVNYLNSRDSTESAEAVEIVITKEGFNPDTVKVKRGAEVVWLNQDVDPHQVVGDLEEYEINSGESLNEGDSYSFVFDQTGTFSYHDPLNPTTLKGTVVVE